MICLLTQPVQCLFWFTFSSVPEEVRKYYGRIKKKERMAEIKLIGIKGDKTTTLPTLSQFFFFCDPQGSVTTSPSTCCSITAQ